MTAAGMVLAVALPLGLAPLCLAPATRAAAFAAAPWAAAPALILALGGETGAELELPAVLVGVRLALDDVARTFLLFTSIIGLLAGGALYATLARDPRRFRFAAFYLAALAGGLGASLAYDLIGFYTFFALLTFAAYGFVIHQQDAAARRAARIYIVLAVLGEGMLLAGLLFIAASGAASFSEAPAAVAESPRSDAIVALLLAGFGAKAGLFPLHVALPPAYAVAPLPGAVLLAGALIHAGLLGWLRLLPLGVAALPGWGAALVLVGVTAMFYGVAVGLAQTLPKAMLAYSSISQMGFMIVALGLALIAPPLWPLVLPAVLVYATHHALVKGTLFLGVGVAAARARRGAVIAALGVPALMLAGAPFTSGAVAKFYLKAVARAAPAPWSGAIELVLPLGALGTALLLARFLYALRHAPVAAVPRPRLLTALGIAALGAAALLVWRLPQVQWSVLRAHWREPAALWSETWPVLAAAVAALVYLRRARGRHLRLRIPPGDIVVPAERLWRRSAHAMRRVEPLARWIERRAAALRGRRWSVAGRLWQGELQRWSVGGMLFLLLIAVVLLLLLD